MPAPRPLTLCPPAALDWSRPGTPAAPEFGDIYFSTDGGLDETRAVFLRGCGLPEAWQETERFVIGELGFGSGLNFLAARQLWDKTAPHNGHLHFVSIEKFPFDTEQLRRALLAWPELKAYADELLAQWPGRVRGFHRLHFGTVTLTLIHDDIMSGLDDLQMQADAWFLDGFSPAKNPDMWSPAVMKKLAALSVNGAKLATFTVAGAVRQALSEAGFTVERKEGFGRKRHRLEAIFGERSGQNISYTQSVQPTIIGTGIGGLSLAQAFRRRGIQPHIISDPDHIAASGNAAALVKPRLDLQDRPESRFFLGSYLYALKTYHEACLHRSITHIPKSDSDLKRHHKLLAQPPLPENHLTSRDNKAMFFPSAQVICPASYRDAVLSGLIVEKREIKTLKALPFPLFIAAGYGIAKLIPEWPMRFSRGQITWVTGASPLNEAISYGGYAIPAGEDVLLGATHDRLVSGNNPYRLQVEDDVKNIAQAKTHLGLNFTASETPSRASVRVTSQDTLPVIGQINQNQYVLTGLGSRGFVFAPLLAEALVSEYFGDPLPVARSLWEKLSHHRLLS